MTIWMKKPYIKKHVTVEWRWIMLTTLFVLHSSLFSMVLVAPKMLVSLAVTVGCWWGMISFFAIEWDKEAASWLFWCCSDFISGRKSYLCTRAASSHPGLMGGEGGFISQTQASLGFILFLSWHNIAGNPLYPSYSLSHWGFGFYHPFPSRTGS